MILKPLQRSREQCVSVSLNELVQLSNYVKQISLTHSRVKSPQVGQHASRLLARGMEFAESRQYQPGDDIRNIDWRVTARTGRAHTKLFAAERERPILLGVDMRPPMFFATQGVFKSVQAALMMGYLAWSASQTGDRLGGIIFDENASKEYRPALGKRGVLPFLNGLASYTGLPIKNKNTSMPLTNLTMDRAIASLRQMASPGSLVFLVSDFRYFSSYAYNLLLRISKHCDLYLCFVYDPIEAALPKNGCYSVTDGFSENTINTRDKSGVEKYVQQFNERRKYVALLSHQPRVRVMECRTDEDCFDILMKYFG
jgi:uncharacterized protein (DUF58 family)